MANLRWEYKISTDRTELAALGEAGWELVGAGTPDGIETFYFKRPFPSIRSEITLAQREEALRKQKEGRV